MLVIGGVVFVYGCFFFQAEDGIRDGHVTGVQTCALPISTGIEPDFSLVKFKKLVGGGSMEIVNQTIPRALEEIGRASCREECRRRWAPDHGEEQDEKQRKGG